jgi:hypothetical protein
MIKEAIQSVVENKSATSYSVRPELVEGRMI